MKFLRGRVARDHDRVLDAWLSSSPCHIVEPYRSVGPKAMPELRGCVSVVGLRCTEYSGHLVVL